MIFLHFHRDGCCNQNILKFSSFLGLPSVNIPIKWLDTPNLILWAPQQNQICPRLITIRTSLVTLPPISFFFFLLFFFSLSISCFYLPFDSLLLIVSLRLTSSFRRFGQWASPIECEWNWQVPFPDLTCHLSYVSSPVLPLCQGLEWPQQERHWKAPLGEDMASVWVHE